MKINISFEVEERFFIKVIHNIYNFIYHYPVEIENIEIKVEDKPLEELTGLRLRQEKDIKNWLSKLFNIEIENEEYY